MCVCPGGWCLGLRHVPSCGMHRCGVRQHTGPCLPTPTRPSPPQGPLGPHSPFSFSPNMVRKTVKLMGPGASFTMASSSSFFTLMRPREDTQEYKEGQRGPCLQAAPESRAWDHGASCRIPQPYHLTCPPLSPKTLPTCWGTSGWRHIQPWSALGCPQPHHLPATTSASLERRASWWLSPCYR